MVADSMDWTLLHSTAVMGHTATARLLLDRAPEVAMRPDEGGWLPLHVAAWYGNSAVVEALLAAAASGRCRA